MQGITYKKAGVNIDEGEKLVNLIKPVSRATSRPEVMAGIGGFGALFSLDLKKYKNPVLVSSTDGVGTKLKLAFMLGKHDTIGIDLVAMGVNDVIVSGAEPLFFLDYFATGKLNAKNAAAVIKGIAKGCKEAECALVGGETAEMPDFYREGEYDLAGFIVGVAERSRLVDGSGIQAGDFVLGLPSAGLHTNGYSLARKLLLETGGYALEDYLPRLGCRVAEELLKPHRSYAAVLDKLNRAGALKGAAHITGDGIPGNLPRILPKGLEARIEAGSWPEPPVFSLLREIGNVPEEEMRRTFNLGIGMALVVSPKKMEKAAATLKQAKKTYYRIGWIARWRRGVVFEQARPGIV